MPSFRPGAVPASLLACCLPILAPIAARAADTPLREVIVTATRTPVAADALAVPVIVIGREELERSGASDVTRLLEQQPGLEISRSGGPGQPASLFTRGTDSNHTAVLIDGVRVNPGTIGGAALQNILPESVERIEIVKGPRSTLYGTDAIGGVINVITRAGAARGATLTAGAGGYGTLTGAFDGGAALGARAGIGASVVYRDSDGFAPRTNSSSSGAHRDAVGNLQLEARPADALALRAGGWRSAGRVHYDDFGSQGIQDYSTGSYAASADWSPRESTGGRVALTRAEDLLDQRMRPDFAHTRRDGLEMQGNWLAADAHHLSAGALLSRERTEALSFGTSFDVETRMDQYFVQDQLQRGPHSALLALGHSRHGNFGSHDTWNAEYAWRVDGVRLRAAAGTGFHAPDATDRFGFGGNPLLKPEKSRQVDVGLDWQAGAHALRLDAFDNRIDDLVIYVVTNFVTFDGRNQNQDRAHIRGLEASWQWRSDHWDAGASATWQDPRNPQDDSLLLRRARQRYAAHAAWREGAWRVGGDLLYVGRRDDAGFPRAVEMPGFALLGLSAGWSADDRWDLQLRLDNALDRRYEEIRGYRTARRTVALATRIRFH